jgi:hypothetical protein
VKRILVTVVVALIALDSALTAWFSISMGHSITSILRGLGLRVGNARMTWDDWFFIALCLLALIAAVGMFARKGWARLLALLALGTYGAWATAIAVLPEAWRENVFSIWVDRWVAIVAAMLALIALLWLSSHQARDEFQSPGAVA